MIEQERSEGKCFGVVVLGHHYAPSRPARPGVMMIFSSLSASPSLPAPGEGMIPSPLVSIGLIPGDSHSCVTGVVHTPSRSNFAIDFLEPPVVPLTAPVHVMVTTRSGLEVGTSIPDRGGEVIDETASVPDSGSCASTDGEADSGGIAGRKRAKLGSRADLPHGAAQALTPGSALHSCIPPPALPSDQSVSSHPDADERSAPAHLCPRVENPAPPLSAAERVQFRFSKPRNANLGEGVAGLGKGVTGLGKGVTGQGKGGIKPGGGGRVSDSPTPGGSVTDQVYPAPKRLKVREHASTAYAGDGTSCHGQGVGDPPVFRFRTPHRRPRTPSPDPLDQMGDPPGSGAEESKPNVENFDTHEATAPENDSWASDHG